MWDELVKFLIVFFVVVEPLSLVPLFALGCWFAWRRGFIWWWLLGAFGVLLIAIDDPVGAFLGDVGLFLHLERKRHFLYVVLFPAFDAISQLLGKARNKLMCSLSLTLLGGGLTGEGNSIHRLTRGRSWGWRAAGGRESTDKSLGSNDSHGHRLVIKP